MRLRPLFVLFFISFLAWAQNSHGFSFNNPLIDAVDEGNENKVRALIKSGISPDSVGDFGVTPLMRASFRGNIKLIQLLLESGAYINAADVGGDTALHLAARNGHSAAVEMLLSYGAFIDVTDKEKWTPLMRAVMAKKPDIAKILIDHGANLTSVNDMGESVLVHASMIGTPEIMQMILGNPNSKKISEEQRLTAMEVAEKKGDEKIGQMLVASNKSNSGGSGSYANKYAVNIPETPSTSSYKDSSTKKSYELSPLDRSQQESKFASNAPVSSKYSDNSNTPIDLWNKQPVPTLKANPTSTNTSSTNAGNSGSWGEWGNQPAQPTPSTQKQTASKSGDSYAANSKTPSNLATKITPVSSDEKTGSNQLYTLYLGSFESPEKANLAWQNLSRKNPDVLAKFSPNVATKTIPDRNSTIYNLQAGQFSWKDIAESNCSSLRTRNIECFVMPLSPDSTTSYAQNTPATSYSRQPEQYNSSQYSNTSSSGGYTKGIDNMPWLNDQSQNYASNDQQQYGNKAPEHYEQQKEFFNNLVEGAKSAPSSNQPIDMNNNAPIPQKKLSDADVQKEVREMTRKQFFKQQGVQEPEVNKNYVDFYKDLDKKNDKNGSVSEAVLVPDETYFSGQKSSGSHSGGRAWVTISTFSDKKSADDYSERMFKSDESLSSLQIMLIDTPTPNGSIYSLKVGPVPDSGQASNICGIVKSSGMNCKIDGSNESSASASAYTSTSPSTTSTQSSYNNGSSSWINLGTFADEPEAEYYWMFLQEDHEDLLKNMQYAMTPPGKNNSFGKNAVQLRVGPFYTKNRADQLCGILRYRNVACLVQ